MLSSSSKNVPLPLVRLPVHDGEQLKLGKSTWTARFRGLGPSSELELTRVRVDNDEKQEFERCLADRKHELQMRKQDADALKAIREQKISLVEQVHTHTRSFIPVFCMRE